MEHSEQFKRVATKLNRILDCFERNEISDEAFFHLVVTYGGFLNPKIVKYANQYLDKDFMAYRKDSIDRLKETKDFIRTLLPFVLSDDEMDDEESVFL